ncbi:MAG TPA: tetratricopeptide repeat protein [Thiobacillaceae bacterium]|nr:tetratricopeptide repeat protein [Thiobacillaceae bacterium]HNU63219.1 tetratricopeptide repeat protein [Thiobacillaceae bacterium]
MSLTRFSAAFLLSLLSAVALAAPSTLQDATQAMRKGQNAIALDKVNAYLSNNPKDAQGRFLKGLILTELGRNPEAIKVFTELTEDYPELPEPYNNLAVLYAAQADYEHAKQSLEMAIRTHPSYATAHENLGDIYAKLASQAYDKAMQLDKANVSAQTKLALIQELFSPTSRTPEETRAPAKPEQTAQTSLPQEPDRTAAPPTQPGDSGSVGPVLAPKDAVLATVHAWSTAWSGKDVRTYLSFYDADFKTPRNTDRATWEAMRTDRLTTPEYIKLDISQIKVSIEGDSATVRFRQRYESNTYKSNDYKTLILVHRDGAWKILEER